MTMRIWLGAILLGMQATPACAQACPTNAITFGLLDDPGSLVSQLSHHEHGFRHLEELNTLPRITYLKEG